MPAFISFKNTLIFKDVILRYPNFSEVFVTTDVSDYAIGAVAFISTTLSQTDENYETAKKEMLAISWAVKSLRGYLYGCTKLKIYTDHEPLTHDCN